MKRQQTNLTFDADTKNEMMKCAKQMGFIWRGNGNVTAYLEHAHWALQQLKDKGDYQMLKYPRAGGY